MTLDDDKLLVRLYQVKIGELEQQLQMPKLTARDVEELKILRALHINRRRMEVIQLARGRCTEELAITDAGSLVQSAPIPDQENCT